MAHFPITEAAVREATSSQSYQRGMSYHKSGAVFSIQRRGNQITAEVEGSEYDPYLVSITISQTGLQSADCSCPFDWGGYCKHIVAVLLACIHSPEKIDERASLEDLLAGLREDELRKVMLSFAESHPEFANEIEGLVQIQGQLRGSKSSESGPKVRIHTRERQTSLDPEPFRRQASHIIHSLDRMSSSEAYWHVEKVVSQLGEIVNQAWKFIEAGDGNNAIIILEALTEEYIDEWYVLDDSNGEASGFFGELGNAWTEAILTSELSQEERRHWADKFTRWQHKVDDYVPDFGFDVAQAAAIQGWDYPPLVQVLQDGEITQKGAWEGEAPWYADDLAVARLKVLERQDRIQEYLYLAEAEGQTERYLIMLVKSGRSADATEYGLKYAATYSVALALAIALQEQDEIESALKVGEHGLTLDGYHKIQLARWLRDVAAIRKPGLAIRAAEIAFDEGCNMADYLTIQSLTGEEWSQYKARLLKQLQKSGSPDNKIEIYLHEGMIPEAIKIVDGGGYLGFDNRERVIEAAATSHPDWAIRQCQRQAEEIMDAGRSKSYDVAAEWLQRAKRISIDAGKIEQWGEYLHGILSKHAKKYSLVPKLKQLM